MSATRISSRLAGAGWRAGASLSLVALQLACTTLPPPPRYAPVDDEVVPPGLAYCNQLESAAADRRAEYTWAGLGLAAGGVGGTIAGTAVLLSDASDDVAGGAAGVTVLVIGAGALSAALGMGLLASDTSKIEDAAHRGGKFADDEAAFKRCLRAYRKPEARD